MEADVGRKGVEGAGGCLGEGPWDGVGRERGGKTCEARLAKAKVEEQECWRRWGPEPE